MGIKFEKFLIKIGEDLNTILGENFFGFYIYGSLTYGGFRPKSSDLDCVAVTKKVFNRKEFDSLSKWYSRLLKEESQLAKRLEIAFAVKKIVFKDNSKRTAVIHKGEFNKRADSDANNPITWLNIKETGITVLGPDPETFVPDITKIILKDALKKEFKYIVDRPDKFFSEDWSKVYVILTFCRIVYTLKTGKIKSKKSAAEWCLENLPKKYHPIIFSAAKALAEGNNWKNLCHPAHGVSERSMKEINSFSQHVRSLLYK